MKNILVLTYYFEPDLSAGSFRNTALVKELSAQLGDQGKIHVITTQPNRYKSFRDAAKKYEEIGGNVRVHRIQVPPHSNGFKDQINSYRVYYQAAFSLIKNEKIDLVYASSSRLFTAYLGKVLSKRIGCPLYLDIRDIFVETMVDVLRDRPIVKNFVIKFIEFFIERPTFRSAAHINMVSEGFRDYCAKISKANFTFYPNGIDEEFIGIKRKDNADRKVTITYAGNIGEGQGLEKVVPQTAKLLGKGYLFKIIGDGGTKGLLQEKIREENLTNVELLDPVKRADLLEIYSNSDFLFLHLNNYKAFERVLPSKIFEYGATNLPMVAGVGGFAKEFIDRNVSNSFTFDPCDANAFANWIQAYRYTLSNRIEFVENFRRTTISKNLAASILSYLHISPQVITFGSEGYQRDDTKQLMIDGY